MYSKGNNVLFHAMFLKEDDYADKEKEDAKQAN